MYVIQSQKDSRLYVGFSQNVENRLKQHNGGEVFSTKGYRPWVLVYTEFGIVNRVDARHREKFLKSGCGKEFVKKKIDSVVAQR